MNADVLTSSPGPATAPQAARRRLGIQLAVDIVAPLALFYLLRQAGTPVLAASAASGAGPAVHALVSLARGRVDVPALVMITLFAAGTAVALLRGDPRIIFAKDGWLTGLLGLWVIVSLRMRRPFMLHLGRNIATVKEAPKPPTSGSGAGTTSRASVTTCAWSAGSSASCWCSTPWSGW